MMWVLFPPIAVQSLKPLSQDGVCFGKFIRPWESLLPHREYAEHSGFAAALPQELVLPPDTAPHRAEAARGSFDPARRRGGKLLAFLALLVTVVLIHGYHPWSDD